MESTNKTKQMVSTISIVVRLALIAMLAMPTFSAFVGGVGSGTSVALAAEAQTAAESDAVQVAPDISGEWEFVWNVEDSTCSDIPQGLELTMPGIIVSQQGYNIELFSPGYDNVGRIGPTIEFPIDAPVVPLKGHYSMLDGRAVVGASYGRTTEKLDLFMSEDGTIDEATVWIDYGDLTNADGSLGCSIQSTMVISGSEKTKRIGSADIATVCDDADICDYTDIQTAVDAASDGTMIKVAKGEYTGEAGDDAVVTIAGKDVILRGGYSPTNWTVSDPIVYPTIINGEDARRGIAIKDSDAIVSGFHIEHGKAAGQGGAYRTDLPKPDGLGGGVYIENSTATFIRNAIRNNTALAASIPLQQYQPGMGGGIAASYSTLTIRDSMIISNTAQAGGGTYTYSSTLKMDRNIVSHNMAVDWASDTQTISNTLYGRGGGIATENNEQVTIQENVISQNMADDDGGGIAIGSTWANVAYEVEATPTTITGNTISGNISGGLGGGGGIDSLGSTTYFGENVITANQSSSGGDGFAFGNGHYIVANNMVVENTNPSAPGMGLVFAGCEDALAYNNTIANNQGILLSAGVGVSGLENTNPFTGQKTYYNTTVHLANNIISGHTVGVAATSTKHNVTIENTLFSENKMGNTAIIPLETMTPTGESIPTTNDVEGDPNFIAPLKGNYHLGTGSAAIDAGTDVSAFLPVVDIDGNAREIGDDIDLGADEKTTNIEGVWDLRWKVSDETTCPSEMAPVGFEVKVQAYVSQSGDDIELFTTGYGDWTVPDSPNLPPGYAIELPGTFKGDKAVVAADYLHESEVLTLTVTEDGQIDSGKVTITYHDYGCQIVSDLDTSEGKTQRTGDLPVLTVCDVGCNYNSIQAAVDAAEAGDMIKVATGTYTGEGSEVVAINKDIIVRGGYHMRSWAVPAPINTTTFIDGQGKRRGIHIGNDGTAPKVILTGLTIHNSTADGLSGDSHLVGFGLDNPYGVGAGIYSNNATLSVIHTQLVNNSVLAHGTSVANGGAIGLGGGIGVVNTTLMLRNSAIVGNSSNDGGGVYAFASPNLTFSQNAILDNHSVMIDGATYSGYGGGLTAWVASDATFQDNLVCDNIADNNAGGILFPTDSTATNPSIDVIGNIIYNNTARTESASLTEDPDVEYGQGGGAVIDGAGNPDAFNPISANVANNVIIGNKSLYGSGFTLSRSNANVVNNIVASNTATDSGAGMVVIGSNASLNHNTIANNSGSGIELDSTHVDVSEPIETHAVITNTILAGNTTGVAVDDNSYAMLTATLWYENGTDPVVASVESNQDYIGDPGFLNAAAGNYLIGPESAAIGKAVASDVFMDIQYQPRPQPEGTNSDIGADEETTVETASPPEDITLSNDKVAENKDVGTEVGTLDAIGGTSPYTFTLASESNEFDITDGNKLVTKVALDYETTQAYTITVQVEDANGLTYEKDFVITVTNDTSDDGGTTGEDITLTFTQTGKLTIEVFIPAEALAAGQEIFLLPIDAEPTNVPTTGMKFGGSLFKLEPLALSLEEGITIKVSYSPDISDAEAQTMKLYFENGDTWLAVEDMWPTLAAASTEVDTENQRIIVDGIMQTGTFATFYQPASTQGMVYLPLVMR